MECVRGIDAVLENASYCRPTLPNGVPLFYDRLAKDWEKSRFTRDSLKQILGIRLRRLASGGAVICESIQSRFANAGLPIYQG